MRAIILAATLLTSGCSIIHMSDISSIGPDAYLISSTFSFPKVQPEATAKTLSQARQHCGPKKLKVISLLRNSYSLDVSFQCLDKDSAEYINSTPLTLQPGL